MFRKLNLLVSVVMALCLVGNAAAVDSAWKGGYSGESWCDPQNWTEGVPGAEDTAIIVSPPRGPIVLGPACDANVFRVRGPAYQSSYTQVMDIIDANFIVQDDWYLMTDHGVAGPNSTVNIVGDSIVQVLNPGGGGAAWRGQDQGRANLNILRNENGAPDVFCNGTVAGGDNPNGYFVFNMDGGRFDTAGGGLSFGNDGGGEMYVSGATTELHLGSLYFGCRTWGSTMLFNMSGRLIDIAGVWEVGDEGNDSQTMPGAININFDAGTIICNDFSVQTTGLHPNGIPFSMDFEEDAVLEIRQDIKSRIEGYIAEGWITGKDDTVAPLAVLFRGHTLVGFDLYQEEASNPSPESGTPDICPTGLTLTWDAGDKVDQHEIFFGTDFDDVNSMTDPCATKSVGDETYDTGWLEYGKTYYWRVDEVNEPNTWKGSVWSFSTPSGMAGNPSPADGRRGVVPGTIVLSWDTPCYLTGQTLSYGTTFPQDGTWTQVALGPGENSYSITTDKFKYYYWRVDTDDGTKIIQGSDWDFRTGYGGLLLHYKFDGSMGADLPSTVTDDSGNGIEFTKYIDGGYVKYGESNPDTVLSTASADFEPDGALFRLDPCGPSELTPDLLRLDGSEYTVELWVKPENWTHSGQTWLLYKHGAWGLKMDSGPGCGAGLCDENWRWMAGGNGNDKTTGYQTVVIGEWNHLAIVRDEGGDLGGFYINGEQESDGSAGTNPPDNNSPIWIGAAQLPDSSFTGGFYDGPIDELRIHDIALAPCAFLIGPGDPEYPICPTPQDGQQEVDPCSVILSWSPGASATKHKVYLGTDVGAVESLDISTYLGEFVLPASNSLTLDYGTVYYWRVVEQPGGQEGDVWHFVTEYQIVDPTLLLHYPFDEMSGDTAYDASGHGFHGDIDGYDYGWDPTDGQFGGSRIFDDDTAISASGGVFDNLSGGVSISLWLKNAYRASADNWVFDCGFLDTYIRAAVVTALDDEVLWRAGLDPNDSMTWNLGGQDAGDLEGWHHWVFIKNEATGELSLYFDAELVASKMGLANTLSVIGSMPLVIGALTGHENDLVGKMDDFRVYDYAIPESKVIELFRGGDLGQAWRPEPRDGATDVPLDTDLVWSPGDFAETHRVYFGTSSGDVDSATTATAGIYKGPQEPNSYDALDTLEFSTWYFWRIDEVNDSCAPNLWKGKVWKFRTANFLIVDDMESYSATSGSGNEIFDTWDDGFVNWTGSQLQLEYGSGATVHASAQSMKFAYDNAVGYYKYSEVDANTTGTRPGNLKVGKDWTETSVRTLTLFFHGEAGNDTTEQMYVALEDGSKVLAIAEYGDLGEDMADVAVAEWHQWDIPLSAFEDNGVSLADVNKVRIGFGDRVTPVPGGSGIVYFDNIRLYLPKCVPWLAKPAADLSDNCIVDFDDVVIMAGDWLRTDRQFDTVQEPDYAKRVGWWKLDNNPYDDSGNFFDGTPEGDYAWVSGLIGTGAIELKGNGSRVLVPHAALLSPQDEVSVCAWVNYSTTPSYSARVVAKGADAGSRESYALQVTDGDNVSFFVRDVNTTLYGTDSSSELRHDEWTHIAGTYDGNVVKCYVDGELSKSETAGLISILVDTTGLAIGNRADGTNRAFIGTIDDVQLYEYALSEAEIVHAATEGSGYMPLTAVSNLYNEEPESERAVNLRDYAFIADSWLEEILWP